MTTTKPFCIAKQAIWNAYKKVRANKGAAGVDAESIAQFEQHLTRNLYKVWNRMSSGSYLPPPVKQIEIPKKNGGKRTLGIPTVSDRIAQMTVKLCMEPMIEPYFHADSYGYRPGKSAKAAIAVTRQRCWKYDWVVEFDIKGAFDNIDHDLLMKAVRRHVRAPWMLLYIERWLTAPYVAQDGAVTTRSRGTPQGGVISPLLMNLFMHYAFDKWMERSHPQNPFARYADDAVVHCRTQAEAEQLLADIGGRLAECGLTLHPEKSKTVYCRDGNRQGGYQQTQFVFLGFCFRSRAAISRAGKKFTGFLPGASKDAMKAMRQKIKSWKLHRQVYANLEALAEKYNATLRGWWNYYGSYYRTEMRKLFDYLNQRLALWARRKYRKLRGHKRRSSEWLNLIMEKQPTLFHHWQVCRNGWITGAV